MLFYLLAGHALMDFALQTEPMAVCKCRRANHPLQQSVPWFYWLTAHALLHGAIVGVIIQWSTGNAGLAVAFAIAEFVVHWFIDFGKCEKLYGIHVDQALHVLCKLAWWGLIVGNVVAT
ncbi:MAG TPA: DUF3307 domain-containing protein [Gemmataceae bacterium]|jgi:hypothetical protein